MIEQSLSLVVVPLPGDAVADATAWVGGIAVVAGDDVAMEMKDGLAGGLAAVHTQVIAIGLVTSVNHLTGGTDNIGEMRLFLDAEVPIIQTMFLANDQAMSGGNGVSVFHDPKMFVTVPDFGRGYHPKGVEHGLRVVQEGSGIVFDFLNFDKVGTKTQGLNEGLMIFLGPIAVQEVTNGMTQIASLEEVFKEFGLEMADLV
jgi:hypothetical protein